MLLLKQNIGSSRNIEKILEGRGLAAEGLVTQQADCLPGSPSGVSWVPLGDCCFHCHAGTPCLLLVRPFILFPVRIAEVLHISKPCVQRENKTEIDKDIFFRKSHRLTGYRFLTITRQVRLGGWWTCCPASAASDQKCITAPKGSHSLGDCV